MINSLRMKSYVSLETRWLGVTPRRLYLMPMEFLRIGSRICVPKVLIRFMPEETHCSRYSIHPGAVAMYYDFSQDYGVMI